MEEEIKQRPSEVKHEFERITQQLNQNGDLVAFLASLHTMLHEEVFASDSDVVDEAYGLYGAIDSLFPGSLAQVRSRVQETRFETLCRSVYESRETLLKTKSAQTISDAANRYTGILGGIPTYKLSEGELNRVQTLINELRTEITNCQVIEDNHRWRLLKKLEDMQKELHRTMSKIDAFWGFIVTLGGVLGRFGKDVKPLIDRAGEMVSIYRGAEARFLGLPSLPKQSYLPSVDDDTPESP